MREKTEIIRMCVPPYGYGFSSTYASGRRLRLVAFCLDARRANALFVRGRR